MSLNAHLTELTEKHKLLERKLEQEMARPSRDDVHVRRLKSEKLKVKDQIARLSAPMPVMNGRRSKATQH